MGAAAGWVLAMALLTCGAARPAAAQLFASEASCRPDQNLNSNKGSGCQQCDGTKCSQCWLGYSLASDGTCTRCETATPGVRCLACDPEQPTKCLKCEGENDGGEPGIPVYAAADGTCTACPANCTACDGTGLCTMCAVGHTWYNGTCGPCTDPDCDVCQQGNPASCDKCSALSHKFAVNGTCTPCTLAGCSSCIDAATCEFCFAEFRLDRGQCLAIVEVTGSATSATTSETTSEDGTDGEGGIDGAAAEKPKKKKKKKARRKDLED